MTSHSSRSRDSRRKKVGQKEVTDTKNGGETDEEDSEAEKYAIDVNHNNGKVVMKLKKF